MSRHFNSLSTAGTTLGPGWLLNVGFDVRLEVRDSAVVFHAPSGYQVEFTEGADGFTAEEPGFDATLTRRTGGGYQLEYRSEEKWFFDAAGKWTSQADANGNTISFDYAASAATGGQPALSTVTDTRGRTVSFDYANGRLTQMYDHAGGRTYAYGYDAQDRLASFALTSDGLGKDNVNRGVETTFGYDAAGRLTRVTDPRGHSTTFTYEGTSRRIASMTQVIDESTDFGPTTRFSYSDTLDKCADEPEAVAETRVDGPRTNVTDITTYCVDEHDRVVATIDAKGHKAGKKYTSNSNVAELNESGVAGGPAYTFDFSSDENNLTGISLPTGGQASLDYRDAANEHLPTAVRDFSSGGRSAPATWAYDYDDDGNLIEADNPVAGITYRYCYHADGTVARVAQPQLDGVPLDTDTDGNACAGHPQGNDTLLTYNADGELVRYDPPGSHRTETFTYDALSRVKTRTDGRGVTQTFSYDALDHVTEIAYEDPAGGFQSLVEDPIEEPSPIPPDDEDAKHTWIKYSYDPNGNLVARSDASGNTEFAYDSLNRMTKESPESPSAVVTYSYDRAGNATSIQTSDAPRAVTYTYDETNLPVTVTDVEGRTTDFGYDKNYNRTSTGYPNGVTMKARYDDSGRMLCTYAHTGTGPGATTDSCPEPSTALLTFFEYSYSATIGGVPTDTNRRESVTGRSGATTAYSYDGAGRLTDATTIGTGGTTTRRHQYTYDDRGNLTLEEVTGTQATGETRTQAYRANNELCWTATGDHTSADCGAAPTGATSYSYDANGNMTGIESGLQMTYSLRGHMIEVTPPGLAAVEMAYTDATQDRRIESDGMRMSYSQLGLASQAPTNASSKATWFVRDPHQKLVGMLHADDTKTDLYYLFDGLGSVAATTDTHGNVVQRYAYEPYGEQINPAAGDTNPWRYVAGYHDKATGMLKFGTRYYMPDLARWTQPDPVKGQPNNPATLNPYAYVGCDPIDNVDPTGRSWDDFGDFWSLMAGCGSATLFFAEASLATGMAGYVFAFTGPIGEFAYWTVGGTAACLGGMAAAGFGIEEIFNVPIF